MSFVYGIDPDSHLLGGWQLDPIKLKMIVWPQVLVSMMDVP